MKLRTRNSGFIIALILVMVAICATSAIKKDKVEYWNSDLKITSWRLPLPYDKESIRHEDITGDGKPDIIRGFIGDSIPIIWIDDDGNMSENDLEGDQVNDCLLIDLNKDGIFGGPGDLSIDWTDLDNDGIADMQLIVKNGDLESKGYFDWGADYLYIIDYGEKDGIKGFIDWQKIALCNWYHNGFSNFYTDYHGNTLFLKMHASSFHIDDLRYSWENPFLFYDKDGDRLTEMTVRLLDNPKFRPKQADKADSRNGIEPKREVLFSKKITYAAFSYDVDNDNGAGNEFDLDMSLRFTGKGFDYSDQVHKLGKIKRLKQADKLIYDARWRNIEELIYPNQDNAQELVFTRGEWNSCWFVFDEDDDCNRWERVEFYEPRDISKIGRGKGGLDNNAQSDAVGDRGEWDMDCSGKGNLYIAPFDGRIHLYGAEWGAWRIDQNAHYYQGYGGLYPPIQHVRLQDEPDSWATIRYKDTDNNGFFDLIEYDLDGDFIFETQVSLKELGIDDKAPIYDISKMSYDDVRNLFNTATDKIWNTSQQAIAVAQKMGISTAWYAFYKHPRSLFERYQYGYWLNFYIYKDLRHWGTLNGNESLVKEIDKAYFSGNWEELLD